MHPLSSAFQRRIAPLAFIALLACDRQKGGVPPTDSAGAAADTAVPASVDAPPADAELPGEAPPRNDPRPPPRATLPSAKASRPPVARDTSAVIAPSSGATTVTGPPAEAVESTVALPSGGAPAQPQVAPPAAVPPPGRRQLPFVPGEKLVYDVRFGSLKVGTGTMEVSAIDTVRGREVYHTTFRIRGGTLVYKVNDRYESWFDTQSLVSLRYRQDIDQGSYERERRYEIFPERARYSENGKPEQASVTEPLDDGSFIYFIRSIPLEVGQTYEFHRYFRPDRNPVTIQVLRRERVRVPAGSFDAIVVRPVIKARGIFSEGGHAELWLADDSTRVMLQLKSKLSFGSLNLYLKSVKRP